jgi:hypothetical protein
MHIALLLAFMLLPASASQTSPAGQQEAAARPTLDPVRKHVVDKWATSYAPRLAHCEAREGETPKFVSVDKLDCGPAWQPHGSSRMAYTCRFEIVGRFADGSERGRSTAEDFQWEKGGSLYAMAVIPPASPELAKCSLFRP